MFSHKDLENIHSFHRHLFGAYPVPDTILAALHLIFTINLIFIICLILQIIGVLPVSHTQSGNHITTHIILELALHLPLLSRA